jgi:hypothetical protein
MRLANRVVAAWPAGLDPARHTGAPIGAATPGLLGWYPSHRAPSLGRPIQERPTQRRVAPAPFVPDVIVNPDDSIETGAGAATGSGKNALHDIWDGIVHVWNDVPLRTVLAVIAVVNFVRLPGTQVGLPALAYERFTLGAVALGAGFAAFGLGAAARARRWRQVRPPRLSWLMAGTAVPFGACLAAVGLVPSLPPCLWRWASWV